VSCACSAVDGALRVELYVREAEDMGVMKAIMNNAVDRLYPLHRQGLSPARTAEDARIAMRRSMAASTLASAGRVAIDRFHEKQGRTSLAGIGQ
jgi:hypothetical protein